MAKIVLDTVTGGYDLSVINNNFDKIETELQNKVLYRNNPVGEANTLETDVDTNGKRIYNLPEPLLDSEPARLQDLQNAVAGAAANLITFTPYGHVAGNNVQAAVQELIDDTTNNGVALPAFLKDSNTIVVDNISALKAIDKTKFTKAQVLGYYTKGDGGGGVYWFDPSDTVSADNGGTVIVAADGARWKLLNTAVLSVRQFGAKGDGVTDDAPAIQAAFTAAAAKSAAGVDVPSGTFLLKNPRSDAAFTCAIVISGLRNCVVRGSPGAKFIVGSGGAGVAEFGFFRVEQCVNTRFTGFEMDGSGITITGTGANRSNGFICANFDVNTPANNLAVSNAGLEFDHLYIHDVGGGITVARRSQTLASTPYTEVLSVHDCRMKNLLGVDHGVSMPCVRSAVIKNNRVWNEIETVTIQDNMAFDASSEAEDILIENNWVRGFVFGAKSETALNAGPASNETRSSKRVTFSNNIFEEIGHPTLLVWPGPSGGDTFGIKLNSQDGAVVNNTIRARTIGVTTGGLGITIAVVNTHNSESHCSVADNRTVGGQYGILHNDTTPTTRNCSVSIVNNRVNDAVLYGILAQANVTVLENKILRAGKSAILCQTPNNSFFRRNIAIDCSSTTNSTTSTKVVFTQDGAGAFSGVMEWSDNIIMDSRGASAAEHGYFLQGGTTRTNALIFTPGYTSGLLTAVSFDMYSSIIGESLQLQGTLNPPPRTVRTTNSPASIAPWNAMEWRVGDRAILATPAVGSPKSWVCTVAGTPGTWVSEGNL